MIGKLRGTYDSSMHDHIILDCNGVGYVVYVSSQTLNKLPQKGSSISLLIDTHVREEYIHLYGFLSVEEQIWFRNLFTVQGVGGRLALAILSSIPLLQLIQAIASEDKKLLCKADGVGPKLALRIATELSAKAIAYLGLAGVTAKASGAEDIFPIQNTQTTSDAVSALINLGYSKQEAFTTINRIAHKEEELNLDQLIKLALRELSQ